MLYSEIVIGPIMNFLWVIITALVFSWIFRKARLPPLLGAIIAGLVIGPSGLDLIDFSNPLLNQWILFLGSMGGLVLVFLVGLESSIQEIVSFSKPALAIGLSGLFTSLFLAFLACQALGIPAIQAVVIGIALSISTSIPALTTIMSMKKGTTKTARLFSVASLVDDIFGLILLFLVMTSFSSNQFNILGLIEFLVLMGIFWGISIKVMPWVSKKAYDYFDYPSEQTTALLTLIFIIIAAIASESFFYEASFGVFLLGLAFSTLHPLYKYEIKKIFLNLGDVLLFPSFFVMIGINANLASLSPYWLWVLTALVLAAILGKVLGAVIAKEFARIRLNQALAIGLALIPRGGMTLLIGSLAMSQGLITNPEFSTLVLVVIITTLLAPVATIAGFKRIRD